MIAAVLFGILIVLLLIGVPIAVCLGVSAFIAFLIFDGQTALIVIPQRMFVAADSYIYLAVPFFMLAGELMLEGGLSERLVRFVKALFGKIPASLACVCTGASAFFGAISGSNTATVAAIGGSLLPSMKEDGYPVEKAAACAAASGTLGQIIPPSIPMVTFAVNASVSVGAIFVGGIIPGLILAGVICMVNIVTLRKYDRTYKTAKFNLRECVRSLIDAIPALMMPVIILGGIYSGVFTPTEAASIASVFALIVGVFVYKSRTLKITWSSLRPIFTRAAINSATCLFVVSMCGPFQWLLTSSGAPAQIASALLSVFDSKFLILLMMNLLLLFLGCFLDCISIILILSPILIPITSSLGIPPLALGVIMIVNTSIGQITPPMASNLFVACRISGCSIERITPSILPYVLAESLALIVMTYFPDLIMLLPGL